MVALKIIGAIALLFESTTAKAQSVDIWWPFILEASARFGVPTGWIERVMKVESGGRTMVRGRPIVSRAGAIGLMQLMPATWAAMRASNGLGPDPRDPHDNILAGTAYLRAMYVRFGYPGLFAAYNAGPGRYAGYIAGQATLPAETRAYLAQMTGRQQPPGMRLRQAPAALFVIVERSAGQPAGRPSSERPAALFIALAADRAQADAGE